MGSLSVDITVAHVKADGDLLDLLCDTVHAVIGRTFEASSRGREATSSQCRDSPGGVFRLDLCGARASSHFGKQSGAG